MFLGIFPGRFICRIPGGAFLWYNEAIFSLWFLLVFMNFLKNIFDRVREDASLAVMVIVNMIPLVGITFWGWDLEHVLFLYWAESAVIGFYNILKMLVINFLASLLLVPFFVIHFGGFMIGHLLFIILLTNFGHMANDFFPSPETILYIVKDLWLPISLLFVSHGVSFIFNFIGRREYKTTNISQQMNAPYFRIILMHISIIFGGFFVIALHSPVFMLVILVFLKTGIDLSLHHKTHKKIAAAASEAAGTSTVQGQPSSGVDAEAPKGIGFKIAMKFLSGISHKEQIPGGSVENNPRDVSGNGAGGTTPPVVLPPSDGQPT